MNTTSGLQASASGLPRHRLLLADDHVDVVRELRGLLAPEFDIVLAVSDGDALVRRTAELHPDVVISDIGMPGKNGIDAGREILERDLCGAVVMLTMYDDSQLVREALAAGIRGYVLKVDAGEELISAVRSALRGETYLSSGIAAEWK